MQRDSHAAEQAGREHDLQQVQQLGAALQLRALQPLASGAAWIMAQAQPERAAQRARAEQAQEALPCGGVLVAGEDQGEDIGWRAHVAA